MQLGGGGVIEINSINNMNPLFFISLFFAWLFQLTSYLLHIQCLKCLFVGRIHAFLAIIWCQRMYCLNNVKADFKDRMGIFQYAASFFSFNAVWWLIKIILVRLLWEKNKGHFLSMERKKRFDRITVKTFLQTDCDLIKPLSPSMIKEPIWCFVKLFILEVNIPLIMKQASLFVFFILEN